MAFSNNLVPDETLDSLMERGIVVNGIIHSEFKHEYGNVDTMYSNIILRELYTDKKQITYMTHLPSYSHPEITDAGFPENTTKEEFYDYFNSKFMESNGGSLKIKRISKIVFGTVSDAQVKAVFNKLLRYDRNPLENDWKIGNSVDVSIKKENKNTQLSEVHFEVESIADAKEFY